MTSAETPALLFRHPVLRGFEDTDILPFGGVIESLRVEANAIVPLTFVPAFPIYPPETAWMRKPRTDVPGLILNERPGHGRVAFLPADLDRRFARDNLPDHGDLADHVECNVAGRVDDVTLRESGLTGHPNVQHFPRPDRRGEFRRRRELAGGR